LFGLVSAIDAFASNDTSDNDVRMERLAHLQSLLPQEAQKQLSIDSYFSNFRVMHASAFSLSLRIEDRSFDFDPVLFGRRVSEQLRTEDDPLGPVSEAEGLLTEHQQGVFARQRFRSFDDVKSSYLIERGIYLHLDPSLRAAMTVVRQTVEHLRSIIDEYNRLVGFLPLMRRCATITSALHPYHFLAQFLMRCRRSSHRHRCSRAPRKP
jgi:hypothetical protein